MTKKHKPLAEMTGAQKAALLQFSEAKAVMRSDGSYQTPDDKWTKMDVRTALALVARHYLTGDGKTGKIFMTAEGQQAAQKIREPAP